MTEASVVAVGTPQSFRQQIARALEVETEEIGWAQSATVAEELLINAFTPIDVLVLSPEVKEPMRWVSRSSWDASRRGPRSSWCATTRGTGCCPQRCGPASATWWT